MTVKKVSAIDKMAIAHQYIHENQKTTVLAQQYNVSRRTIQRVLVEMGVQPVRVPKPVAVPLYSVQPELPITMVEPTFIEKVKRFFNSIFGSKQQQTNVQSSK